MGIAAIRWREQLGAWAIPPEILAAAPESPWGFSVDLFTRRARSAVEGDSTPSARAASEALPAGGEVLDVGCGAGAGSLPLASRAGRLVGVDSSPDMLRAFRRQAQDAGVDVETLEGTWPESAHRAPVADIVICHHVVYNAPDLPAFAERLTDHARRRVVVEMTRAHPRKSRNPLWLRFHGLRRPEGPTADDAVEVLRELGIEPAREDWDNPRPAGFGALDDLVASVRKELCLTPDRDPEIRDAVAEWAVERGGGFAFPPSPLVTLWWNGAG